VLVRFARLAVGAGRVSEGAPKMGKVARPRFLYVCQDFRAQFNQLPFEINNYYY